MKLRTVGTSWQRLVQSGSRGPRYDRKREAGARMLHLDHITALYKIVAPVTTDEQKYAIAVPSPLCTILRAENVLLLPQGC